MATQRRHGHALDPRSPREQQADADRRQPARGEDRDQRNLRSADQAPRPHRDEREQHQHEARTRLQEDDHARLRVGPARQARQQPCALHEEAPELDRAQPHDGQHPGRGEDQQDEQRERGQHRGHRVRPPQRQRAHPINSRRSRASSATISPSSVS